MEDSEAIFPLRPPHLLKDLEGIFEDGKKRRAFVEQKGQAAQAWLDRLQMLADCPSTPLKLLSSILTVMLRLSKKSGLYPQCLSVRNVKKLGKYPVAHGGFGDVWKGIIGESNEPVCVKTVKIYLQSDKEKLCRAYMQESIVWRQLKHPNVLPFLGIYYLENDQQLCLISPWMENGNLVQYVKSTPRTDIEHYTLVYDVTNGLRYLHEREFVHGDLKGVNVLITHSKRACIGDFGLSRVIETHGLNLTTSTTRPVGTSRWLAPELLTGNRTSKESDIYAYGCVCYEIFTGLHPFPNLPTDGAVVLHVVQGKHSSRPEDISELNDSMWALMESCWNMDPSARPSADEALSKLEDIKPDSMWALMVNMDPSAQPSALFKVEGVSEQDDSMWSLMVNMDPSDAQPSEDEALSKVPPQLNLFAKKPKRAWSGLARTGLGLLSQLMNPDPEIFPADHPYRFKYSSEMPPQTQQKSKKNLFRVGNEDDDEDWEDDNDSSSMSRSTSLSYSRSRSRSARSRSPSAVTQNPPAGVEQRTKQAPSDDAVPQTNGRSPKDSRSAETRKPSSQQGRPPKQLGTVLGLNGRKVVVATDDDDDYDYDDDEDWEEEDEESEEVDVVKTVNMKENVPSKTPEKQEQRKEEVVLEGDDEDWTSASDDDGGGPDTEPTVTANAKTRPGTTDSTQVPETTHSKTVYTNGNSWQGKSKGKRKQQQPPSLSQPHPPNESKPQHYPNPPAPQLLQRAQSSRLVGGTGGLAQPQVPPPVKRTHSQQPPQQKHPQGPSNYHHHHNNRQQRQSSVDMSQAALEAQRQLDMFAKKPKRAWSELARTGSGLLSQLMNPDPEIFPADHPYRLRYSSGDVGMPKVVTRLGVVPSEEQQQQTQRSQPQQKEVKKSGISSTAPRAPAPAKTSTPNGVGKPMALGLQMSKSSVALPVVDVVTAARVEDGGLVTSRPCKKDQTTATFNTTAVRGGGYRPKGQPQELEDDTDTEGDVHQMEISGIAQQKLPLLTGKRDAVKQPQTKQKNGPTPIRPDISARTVADTSILANPSPMQIQRAQPQHVPGAEATTTSPLPIEYPYNLPPAAPPLTPRTTRQLMLRKDMSESVRHNLFWLRQLSRAEMSGPRRRSPNDTVVSQGEAGIVDDTPPPSVSAVPNLVQLSAKKKPGRGVLVDALWYR